MGSVIFFSSKNEEKSSVVQFRRLQSSSSSGINLWVRLGLSLSCIPCIWLNPLPVLMNLLLNIVNIFHLIHSHYLVQATRVSFLVYALVFQQIFMLPLLRHVPFSRLLFLSSRHNFLYSVLWCWNQDSANHIFPLPAGSLWGLPVGGNKQRLEEEGCASSCWHPVDFLSASLSFLSPYDSYSVTLATIPFHSSSWIQLAVFPTLLNQSPHR